MQFRKWQIKIEVALVFVGLLALCQGNMSAQTDNINQYGIFLDNSGSMFTQIPRQKEVAKAILDQLGESDRISLYRFATKTVKGKLATEVVSFNECSKRSSLDIKQIEEIEVARGRTEFQNALLAAADRLKMSDSPDCGESAEKILILLSDGEDQTKNKSSKSFFTSIKQTGVKVYVVGFIDELKVDGGIFGRTTSSSKGSRNFLQKLASETGGRVIFADKNKRPEEIAADLLSKENVSSK